MPRIKLVKYIYANNPISLTEQVQNLLDGGWEISGDLVVSLLINDRVWYYQRMVKNASKSTLLGKPRTS